MKVFISWSGNTSKKVATALKECLEYIFQGEEVFMSDKDITAGERWAEKLNAELEASYFGIICLTPQNISAPWILFEAGALSKAIKSSVIPYLINLETKDINGPLSQFQSVSSNKEGTLKLVHSINKARKNKITEDKLTTIFLKWWPDLEEKLDKESEEIDFPKPRISEREMLEEILALTREATKSTQIFNDLIPQPSNKPKLNSFTTHSPNELELMKTSDIVDYLAELKWRFEITSSKHAKTALKRLIELGDKELEIRRT